jgi:hypothetical protein
MASRTRFPSPSDENTAATREYVMRLAVSSEDWVMYAGAFNSEGTLQQLRGVEKLDTSAGTG